MYSANEVKNRLVANIDWFTSYSDDDAVYKAGEKALDQAEAWCERNGFEEVFENVHEHMNSGEPWGTTQVPLIDWQ